MTNAQSSTLVFTDQEGNYYLVPQAVIERGRVPAEHKAAVEQLVAEADEDVSGYMVETTYTLFRVLNAGATALGDVTADAAKAAVMHRLLWGEGR